MHFRGNTGRNSHVSSVGEETAGGVFILFQGFPNGKQKKNRQRTRGCTANCAFSRFAPLTLSIRSTMARADTQNQRFAISLRGAQWTKNAHLPTAQGQSPPRRQTTTAQQHPRPHERQPLPEGLPLVHQDRDVASEQKHPAVSRPWHAPRPRSAPRCCGRNGRCARFAAWPPPPPKGRQ